MLSANTMTVRQVRYKDIPAFALTTKTARTVVVPAQGGKIVSFRRASDGKEYLLQNPSAHFLPMGPQDDFERCECAGFDDMFPTVDPVSVRYPDGVTLRYPDHGEVCRVPFSHQATDSTLALSYHSATLGYTYEKSFEEGAQGALVIRYRIENCSARDLDVLWAGHCLINVERGGRLLLPFQEGEPTDVMFDTTSGAQAGERLPLRAEWLATDRQEGVPFCRKFYFPRRAPAGYIAYRSPAGDELWLEFDPDQLPYIGLWINQGLLNGAYCVGLEPATLGYDTVKKAEAHGQKRLLKKGDWLSFFVRLSIK